MAYRATDGPPIVPPGPSRVDLHTHSRRSDGVLEPAELVAAAGAAGVRLMALTDHDTLAGVRELVAGPPADAPELLAGVEINAVAAGVPGLWEGELHVLGLGVDPADGAFEAALVTQRLQRRRRVEAMLGRLRELGLPVDAEFAALPTPDAAAVGRPHIARCLVAAGHAASVDDAMQRLLARGRPAYVPRAGLGPAEAIAAISAAGGLAVLAHFADAAERRHLVAELAERGLGGLEVHYRHFDALTVDRLGAVAAELRLVPTGGSDYHGDGISYAEAHAGLWVPESDGRAVLAALAARRGSGPSPAASAPDGDNLVQP